MVIDSIRSRSSYIDIVGEEESSRTDCPWQIVCDPVDGTFPFTWGMPVATFMIGILHKGVPVMGVIYDPFTNRLYSAGKGSGTFMNEKPLRVSVVDTGMHPVVGYVSWPGCPFNILKACQYLEDHGITLVNFCSIGYIEVAVATGEFAGTIFPGTSHHDTAPGHIIVEEAGGKVTDIFGKPLTYADGKIQGHLMSNGVIHDLLVEALTAANA